MALTSRATDHDRRLLSLRAAGLTWKQVGERVGLSAWTAQRAHRRAARRAGRGVAPTALRRWSDTDDAALGDLWRDGLPIDQIAAAINRSPHACYVRAVRLGLTRLSPRIR